jgi:hypothetical protein
MKLTETESYKSSIHDSLNRVCDKETKLTYQDKLNQIKSDPTLSYEDKDKQKNEIFEELVGKDWNDVKLFVDLMSGHKPFGIKVPKIGEAMKDLLSSRDFPFIWNPAIEIVMKNYIMPQILVSRQIFNTIPYSGQKDQINLKSVGPVQIEEIGSGEPYPEIGPSIMDKAYRMALSIKKYGIKLGIDQELRDTDHWGILGFLASSIADGFVIHEEKMAMGMLSKMGTTIFNNAYPDRGLEKTITGGRDIDGSFNGTISLNDLMTMWTYGQTRGFNYTTLLMHPWAWQMFATNPELREVVVSGSNVTSALNSTARQGSMGNNMNSPFGENWGYWMKGTGGTNPTARWYSGAQDPDQVFGKLGISPASNNLTPWGATFNIAPKYWPGGIRVIVTPYIPFAIDPNSKKPVTNLYFVDPEKTGIILDGEGPVMDTWDDWEREVDYMRFKRKFGMHPIYGGRGVAVARNIVIDKSYVFDNVNSRQLSPLRSHGFNPGGGSGVVGITQ